MGTLREDQYTSLIISRSFLFRMRNVSDESCRENRNTHFMLSNFFQKKCAFDEIKWKNFVKPGSPQITKWRMHIACWIPKATNTRSEFVILIAFTLQQRWHEGASILSSIMQHVACLVQNECRYKCNPRS